MLKFITSCEINQVQKEFKLTTKGRKQSTKEAKSLDQLRELRDVFSQEKTTKHEYMISRLIRKTSPMQNMSP